MGQRAHYVVRERARVELSYSHWGANRLDVDLAWGPEHALQFVRRQQPTEEWLDHVWCEGAALIDVDARSLLWFGGEDIVCDELERRAFERLLAASWRGWTVRWAHDGLNDVLDALGLDRSLAAADVEQSLAPADWGARALEPSQVVTLVTVTDGATRVATSGWLPGDVIARGPDLADDLALWQDRVRLEAAPYGGAHIDLIARRFSYWTGEPMPMSPLQHLPDGWTAERWVGDGLDRHLTVLDEVEIAWPDERDRLAAIVERCMRIADADPVADAHALVDRLRERGDMIELSPWVDAHQPVAMTAENRTATLRRLLAELGAPDLAP